MQPLPHDSLDFGFLQNPSSLHWPLLCSSTTFKPFQWHPSTFGPFQWHASTVGPFQQPHTSLWSLPIILCKHSTKFIIAEFAIKSVYSPKKNMLSYPEGLKILNSFDQSLHLTGTGRGFIIHARIFVFVFVNAKTLHLFKFNTDEMFDSMYQFRWIRKCDYRNGSC